MRRIAGILIVNAWSMRSVARAFYPSEDRDKPTKEERRLQRKWLHAWRRAPGAFVPMSTKYQALEVTAQPVDEGTISALTYLRVAGDR